MTPQDLALADSILDRQITLFRFAAGERAAILRILKQMEEELVELLFYSGKPLTEIGRADKARLLKQAQAAIEQFYGEAQGAMATSLVEVGRLEAAATVAGLEMALQGAIVPSLPTATVLKKLVDGTLIDGAPSAAWWAEQSRQLAFRFQNAVAQGLAQAETNAQIITRVRGNAQGYSMIEGKRVYNYTGGIMQIARHNAAALVQTSVAEVANAARMASYEENGDVIKGFRQLSTLDSRSTEICVAYSGATWNFKKEPTGTNKLPFVSPKGSPNGCGRHWNCRSLILPETKTFKELGLDLPEFPGTTRSASGGPVAADTTFDAFLKRKGAAYADELLGPGRAQLWRDKKITLQQLLDQNGRPLTLKELRKRYG